MPFCFYDGPYAFSFWSLDCQEPPHVHVRRDRQTCKFWLDPVILESNNGFRPHELRKIARIIERRHDELMEVWDEHCND